MVYRVQTCRITAARPQRVSPPIAMAVTLGRLPGHPRVRGVSSPRFRGSLRRRTSTGRTELY